MAKSFSNEADVVHHFKSLLEDATGAHFQTLSSNKGEKSTWATDGVIEWDSPTKTSVRVLLETKFGTDLTREQVRSNVLAQALYYCKRFEGRGEDIPNVILIGDQDHCFVIGYDAVKEFMSAEVDWSRRPSSPDPKLHVEVDVHLEGTLAVDGVKMKEICEQLAEGCVIKVKPSPENISAMYQHWVTHIIPEGKYEPVEMTDIFFGCVLYSESDDHYAVVHPKKKDTLLMGGKEYHVKVSAMNGFFERRQRGLSAKDAEELLSMRDRIIEDDARRRQGAFYTPRLWVDEAHREMEKVLGHDWRDECIVWDCCAGTGNLTRDYDFKNLILSTAEAPDVKAIKREGFNEGAHVFQYDFLNPEAPSPFFEEGDNVLPLRVKELLRSGAEQGKRLVFFINPPYATAGNAGAKGTSKAGVAGTLANAAMKKDKLGACSQQLYAQFMYQCEQVASEHGFEKKSVGIFSPSLFMVSGSFAKFRPFWYERYSYQSGFMFQASQFADVSGAWAISFTTWNEGKTDITQYLPIMLKSKRDAEEIIPLSEKLLYNARGREASVWVRGFVKGVKACPVPNMSSGLKLKEGKITLCSGALLYMVNDSNALCYSLKDVFFISSASTRGHGLSVLAGEAWRRAISHYGARKLSVDTWMTHNDEYLAPSTEIEGYDQWVDDCHIYALLESKNNMTSMRDVEYKGKKWNIHNHFFWLTRKEALDLYGNHPDTRKLYQDAKKNPIPYEKEEGVLGEDLTPQWRKDGDPYFAHILPTLDLSPLANEILDDLKALHVESFTLRSKTTSVLEKGKSIDLHLGAWDAGVYQHKKLWATEPTLKAKWEAIKTKHRTLAQQLEHGVYTYGFLIK